ncbi:hypothetical protein Poly24_17290 [Rosistilla carotiformis]|uniref:DUF1257 domain-containing protein n=1 Tax=Rosistilla carotiformis TaxID=2528017 RepID=A0A518JR56_9BACT|nr:hypothetical protein Poly24_17290 [Rosistilla carotiformis]
MSHVVTIEAQVRDPEALRSSCRRLGLDAPVHQTIKLFTAEATGHCVQLPRWRYPVVCDTDSGVIHYDNYGGHWGEQSELDRLVQRYAVEKTVIESRKQGYTVTEHTLANGSIKLSVQVGGAN